MTTDSTTPVTASTSTEEDVKFDALVIDAALQLRVKAHDSGYIDELVEAVQQGKVREPVVVFRDNDGTLRLADGHARVKASKRAGKDVIRARVSMGDHHAAFVYALGANATHGARRTPEDLRNAVTAALADPKMAGLSNVQIAEVCGCSDRFVGTVRKALALSSGVPPQTHRLGKDGKRYRLKRIPHEAGSNESNVARPEVSAITMETAPEDLLPSPEAWVPGVGKGEPEILPAHEDPEHEGDASREVSPSVAHGTSPAVTFVVDQETHEARIPDIANAVEMLEALARRPELANNTLVTAARTLVYAVERARFLAQYPLDRTPPTPSVLMTVWDSYAEEAKGTPSA